MTNMDRKVSLDQSINTISIKSNSKVIHQQNAKKTINFVEILRLELEAVEAFAPEMMFCSFANFYVSFVLCEQNLSILKQNLKFTFKFIKYS